MQVKKINGYSLFMDKCLGRGSYGSVYVGERDTDKAICAIKIMEKSKIDTDEYLHDALFAEMKILQNLKGQNIVLFYQMLESSSKYYIVQQLCDKDLGRYMDQNSDLSQIEAIRILKEICNGFMIIVKEGVIHRDLKPANIFMSKGVAKIGDFGFAKKNITHRIKNESVVGTPLYMSLQLLKSQSYTSKCDIWAMGLIFYQLVHNGKLPWTAKTQFMLVKNISSKPLIINPNLNSKTRDFIEKCLKLQQKDRISWDQVFLHPIFDGYFNKYTQQKALFQNKLKMIMNELRFQISSNNLNIEQYLKSLNIKTADQLNYQQFCDLFRQLNPKITKEEIVFFFQTIDANQNGKVSVQQLLKTMSKHGIELNNTNRSDLVAKQQKNSEQSFDFKNKKSQYFKKIKKSFIKIHKIFLRKKTETLYSIYTAYDTDRSGQLSLEQFTLMMKRFQEFEPQQILELFNFIDTDGSKAISFEQFYKYYCKINQLPVLKIPNKDKPVRGAIQRQEYEERSDMDERD